MGKLVRRTVSEHARLCRDHSRIGRALELPVQASFWQLELSKFEGSLAWKKSRTKASFSHLQPSLCEGSLARKLEQLMGDEMCWHEMNNNEILQESKLISKKMKLHQISWDKMTWWHELRRAEMRWKTQKTWDELRWDGMTQTAVTEGCNEQFPREAAMRWDQMKWEKIQHSKDMASDWQVKSLLPRSTGGLPVTYRHSLCSAL